MVAFVIKVDLQLSTKLNFVFGIPCDAHVGPISLREPNKDRAYRGWMFGRQELNEGGCGENLWQYDASGRRFMFRRCSSWRLGKC